ncbi:MAG: nucleoside-diphosphate kinase [Thermoplasmata archaeon]|nr:MAG: nucleoside-diphosphate kinase [Thermoplasmata archaeon]
MERTFFMIKPDAVQRGLIGNIIERYERKGLKIIAMKFMQVSQDLAERHYAEHKGKPFYDALVEYITSGPVVAGVLEGHDIIEINRAMMGKTNPAECDVGTIRGDFAMEISRNVIHGSDSLESAKREIGLFFTEEEIIEYTRADDVWLYE